MTDDETIDLPARPSIRPVLSRGVYGLCYCLAFGVVYAGRLASDVIPPDSMVGHGLRDGAGAAHRAWAQTAEEDEIARHEMALPDEAH